jgi:hypothetical protein
MFLLFEPHQQVLEGRGDRHDVRRPLAVLPHFDHQRRGIRRQGAQPRHKPLVLRSLSSHHEVNGDLATLAALPCPEALWALPGQQLNQLVFLIDIHIRSASSLTSYRAWIKIKRRTRLLMVP